MSTLDHNFNEIASGKARSTAEKASYPPPFSIRFTFEERARLDAERGRQSLAAHNPANWPRRTVLMRLMRYAQASPIPMKMPMGVVWR